MKNLNKFDLQKAIREHDKAKVVSLIYGVDIKQLEAVKYDRGYNVVHLAAKYNAVEILRIFLDIGMGIENADNNFKNTPLLMAAYNDAKDAVKLLILKKANLNAQNLGGNTPLHGAVFNGACTIITYLVEAGADYSIKNRNGSTAGNQSLKGVTRDNDTADETNPTFIGIKTLGRALINKKISELARKFFDNVQKISSELIMELDSFGVKIDNLRDSVGTPLVIKAVLENAIDTVRKIIKLKGSVNLKDEVEKRTALHYAAAEGNLDMIKLLLAANSRMINEEDINGQTALHLAVLSSNENNVGIYYEVIQFLILKVANINSVDNKGNTPLDLAESDMIKMVLSTYKAQTGDQVRKSVKISGFGSSSSNLCDLGDTGQSINF